jgi:hypothetical protein
MTIEIFLQAVFQIGIAIVFTAFCIAGVAVSIFYSWKMADNLIRGRERIVGKLKKSKFFRIPERPTIQMVKADRKKAKA